MADNNEEGTINVDSFDFANEGASEETPMLVNYLITRLQQAMSLGGETSKRGISNVREGGNPYEELQNLLLDDTHQSRIRGHAQRQEPPSKEKERSESLDKSMEEDVAPRRRRVQRSPTPAKRKRSPHSPPCQESKKEDKDTKKKKERKRSPSSPSSSPSSSSDESGGYSSRESPRRGHRRSHAPWRRSNKLKKFKEGGKSISFLTYDGTFGATDKVLAFIQQFDAAFGDEGFTESSKLRHIAMHFQKSTRQWWASLRDNEEAPQTWKNLRASIMKQFLSSDAKDKVLAEWQSLKLTPYESIHKYVDKFWDLHLKATVYKKIDFEEQKQQFCAGLSEDMNEYVNSQRPKTISTVIHHTMVAAKINFQQGAKRNLKPMEIKEKHEHKEDMSVLKWSTISRSLVTGYMDLAHEFLADEGFLVTMSVGEHIEDLIAAALRVGLPPQTPPLPPAPPNNQAVSVISLDDRGKDKVELPVRVKVKEKEKGKAKVTPVEPLEAMALKKVRCSLLSTALALLDDEKVFDSAGASTICIVIANSSDDVAPMMSFTLAGDGDGGNTGSTVGLLDQRSFPLAGANGDVVAATSAHEDDVASQLLHT
ncbi:hypothetical protein L7F22_002225 [Adiantum nelumboides]|nr:hypothetical protein [Adiantum nelumboides]